MDSIEYTEDGYTLMAHKFRRDFKRDDGSILKEIKFREPIVADYEAMDAFTGETEKAVHLIARVCQPGLAPSEVRRMPIVEFAGIKGKLESFLADQSEDLS